MVSWLSDLRVVLCAWIVMAFAHAVTAQSSSTAAPVIGVVSTHGLLRPIAAWSGTGWVRLEWPLRESLDAEALPPVPADIASIPRNWFAPLDSLPADWRLQLPDGGQQSVRITRPVQSDVFAGSIAIESTYRDPKLDPVSDDDAGIAVAGAAVTTLAVSHLSKSSSEWRSIVEHHLDAFQRAQALPWGGGRIRAAAALRQWLLRSDVQLWRISRDDGAYFYFDVTDGPMLTGSCPHAQSFEGRIDVPAHGPARVLNVQPVNMTCGDMNEGLELVGAVVVRGVTRFVIKSSGDDWQSYKLVDPETPLTWRVF